MNCSSMHDRARERKSQMAIFQRELRLTRSQNQVMKISYSIRKIRAGILPHLMSEKYGMHHMERCGGQQELTGQSSRGVA